jgi:hypothetical protein
MTQVNADRAVSVSKPQPISLAENLNRIKINTKSACFGHRVLVTSYLETTAQVNADRAASVSKPQPISSWLTIQTESK